MFASIKGRAACNFWEFSLAVKPTLFMIRDGMQRLLVPELRYSQSHYEECLREHTQGIHSWLDIGCGHQVLPPWRIEAERQLVAAVPTAVGVDFDLDSLRKHKTLLNVVRADIQKLPFNDQSFDLVTANMVVEHLTNPSKQFLEVTRVLRPGGVFLFHTPNLNSYVVRIARMLPEGFKKSLAQLLEGRASADVFPTFYLANTAEALSEIAATAGLQVDEVRFTMSTPVFGLIPPLAALELLFLRVLARRPSWARYRQTLICIMTRQ